MQRIYLLWQRRISTLSITVLLIFLVQTIIPLPAKAAKGLGNRFDRMSTSVAGETATHLIGFDITDSSTALGSIEMEFCSNTAIPNETCTAPTGFDVSGSQLSSQTGETGFSMVATTNTILLSRAPTVPAEGPVSYLFDQVINPSVEGTFYLRLQTFTSSDGTGTAIEEGGVALVINKAVDVTTEVPPWLKFCAATSLEAFDCSTANSYLLDLGDFKHTATSAATSQMIVATNAPSGYSITLSGTTLTSGNNVIPNLSVADQSRIGISQFGMNLRANTIPAIGSEPSGIGSGSIQAAYNQPNRYAFNNSDVIVSSPSASDNHKFTASFITNISSSQKPGVYATTISYIALANF